MTGSVTACARCAKDDPSGEVVRLWDGRDYCRGCVEAECPTLWEFARGRDVLEDAIPHDPKGGLALVATLAALFGGGSLLVAAGCWAAGEPVLAFILGGAIGLVTTVSTLACLPAVYLTHRVLPTVRVHSGTVEVYRSAEPGQSLFFKPGALRVITSYPLDSARWHVGRLREDAACRVRGGPILPNRPAVILRAPRKWKTVAPRYESTATGSTPEMIAIWRGFLRLAGVPTDSR